MLQKRARNRSFRRRQEGCLGVPRERRCNIFTGKPSRVIELARVDPQLAAVGMGMAADHQRRWKRPGLARDIMDLAYANACLLEQLARDCCLNILTHLNKAGERRI